MGKRIQITEHAKFQIKRRAISEKDVLAVVKNPNQKIELKLKKHIYQSNIFDKFIGRQMLLRVIVEQTNDDIKVITAYKTSRIDKYWEPGGKRR